MLISTDSVQRPSRTLDSAPWSGEPNPTWLWPLLRRHYIEEVGAVEARMPRQYGVLSPTSVTTDRVSAAPLRHAALNVEPRRRRHDRCHGRLLLQHRWYTHSPSLSFSRATQEHHCLFKVREPIDLLLGDPNESNTSISSPPRVRPAPESTEQGVLSQQMHPEFRTVELNP